jgi:hypothetical protein
VANTYTFERRVIYWENTWVDADNLDDALKKLQSGDADDCSLGEYDDYYDDDFTLVEESIGPAVDPLVEMVLDYENNRQLELFDELFVKEIKL